MKSVIFVFLWIFSLWPVFVTAETELDTEAYFEAIREAPWEHIPESDSWIKVVFEGKDEQIFMLEKVILQSHTERLIGGVVRFSVQSRCDEDYQTKIVMWTAGSESGRLVSCSNTTSFLQIPPLATEKLSPFPQEIQELLDEMVVENKKENVF